MVADTPVTLCPPPLVLPLSCAVQGAELHPDGLPADPCQHTQQLCAAVAGHWCHTEGPDAANNFDAAGCVSVLISDENVLRVC